MEKCILCERLGWKNNFPTKKSSDGNFYCELHAPLEDKNQFQSGKIAGEPYFLFNFRLNEWIKQCAEESGVCHLERIVAPCDISIELDKFPQLKRLRIARSTFYKAVQIIQFSPDNDTEIYIRSTSFKSSFEFDFIKLKIVHFYGNKFNDLSIVGESKSTIINQCSIPYNFDCRILNGHTINITKCLIGKSNFVLFMKDTASFTDTEWTNTANFKECFFGNRISFTNTKFKSGFHFISTEIKEKISFTNIKANNFIDIKGIESPPSSIIFNCLEGDWFEWLDFWPINLAQIRIAGSPIKTNLQFENTTTLSKRDKADRFRALKQRAIKEQNQPLISIWHSKEWDMRLQDAFSNDEWLDFSLMKLYQISSNFGESPINALKTLIMLIASLFYFAYIFHFFEFEYVQHSSNVISCIDYWYACLPLSKATINNLPSISPLIKFWFWLSQILISLQAGMLAFSIRNKFRRQ